MATTPTTLTITSGVSDSMATFGTAVSTALTGLGNIALQDATYRTVLLTNGTRIMTLTLLYWPGGGQPILATVQTAREGTSIDSVVNTYFFNNPTIFPQFMFDISPEDPRVSLPEGVLILYSAVPTVLQPRVVRNLTGGNIASLASGVLTVLGSAGPKTETLTGFNMGDANWANQKEGYCAFDVASGQWLCVPHCC